MKTIVTPAIASRLISEAVSNMESEDGLLRGFCAITCNNEASSPTKVLETVQEWVKKLPPVRGSQPQAWLAHINDVFYEQLGFGKAMFDHPPGPNEVQLESVQRTKVGSSSAVSYLYYLFVQEVRKKFPEFGKMVTVHPVAVPMLVLIAVNVGDSEEMLVDPYNGGRIVDDADMKLLIQHVTGDDPETYEIEKYKERINNRHWVTRAMQTILHERGSTGHFAEVASILEMECFLWPDKPQLRRDTALVYARMGLSQPAYQLLDEYLKLDVDDPQRKELQNLRDTLKPSDWQKPTDEKNGHE